MSRTALRNAAAAVLLALAAASVMSQPRETFVGPAAQAQAMTMPQSEVGLAVR